jgi:hypothetical protein
VANDNLFGKGLVMKARKKCLVIAMAVILAGVGLYVNGCKKSKAAFAESVALCTDCGQIKGSDLCC